MTRAEWFHYARFLFLFDTGIAALCWVAYQLAKM
jgi:hypothetical protein